MVALVTGSGGFIGRHLVRRLLAEGFEVRCLRHRVRRRDASAVPTAAAASPGLRSYAVDFRSPASLTGSGALADAGLVFHLAGVTKGACRAAYFAGNTLPTVNLAAALRQAGVRPRRFLLLSSIAAAGPAAPDRPLGEDDVPRPVEHYGASKLAAEQALASSPGLPYTVLRASAVYGPGDRDFLRLFRQLDHGLNCFYGNRGHSISLLFVTDLVDGLLRAALSERAAGRTYFLGGQTVCWTELQERIAAACGRRIRLTVNVPPLLVDLLCALVGAAGRLTGRGFLLNPQKRAISRRPRWVCSSERARRDFGFRPAHDLERGLAETVRWYREQGWL
jgi:nucleoside-diphosphate-sugar epimerase